MAEDFEAVRQRRVRVVRFVLLVVAPLVIFLALVSFGMDWIVALAFSVIAFAITFVRWRLREGGGRGCRSGDTQPVAELVEKGCNGSDDHPFRAQHPQRVRSGQSETNFAMSSQFLKEPVGHAGEGTRGQDVGRSGRTRRGALRQMNWAPRLLGPPGCGNIRP